MVGTRSDQLQLFMKSVILFATIFLEVLLSHCPREANRAAHFLARNFGGFQSIVWIEELHNFIAAVGKGCPGRDGDGRNGGGGELHVWARTAASRPAHELRLEPPSTCLWSCARCASWWRGWRRVRPACANNLQRHEQQVHWIVHYPTIEPKAIEYYWT
jgi:hypothetical protein